MKTLLLTKKLFVITVFSFFVYGCQLSTKNLTPEKFPLKANDVVFTETLLTATKSDIISLEESDPGNRFLLEVKKTLINSVNAFIIVNGTEHPMTEYNSRLFIYEPENNCLESYDYSFRVRYKPIGYGWKTREINDNGSALRVITEGWNDFIWYRTLENQVHLSTEPGNQILYFGPEYDEANITTIVLRNNKNIPLALYGIMLADGVVGAFNNDKFELTGVPEAASGLPLPPAETFYLMCGEKLIIQIKWIGSVPNEVGALSIHAHGEDFNYNNVLFLKSTSGAI